MEGKQTTSHQLKSCCLLAGDSLGNGRGGKPGAELGLWEEGGVWENGTVWVWVVLRKDRGRIHVFGKGEGSGKMVQFGFG